MSTNYNFLGSINAIYNFNDADENYYLNLIIFNNGENLKILYKDLSISGNGNAPKKGEILLNNIGQMELDLITSKFSENYIKELILYKFLDSQDFYLNFEIIY